MAAIKSINSNRWKAIFIIFVAVYALIMLVKPNLAPTDDFTLLRTLQAGKPMLYFSQNFPYYDAAKLGRFSSVGGMEYNLVGLFSKSPSPFWYYFYHAAQFVIFAVLIVKLLGKFTTNKFILYGVPILLFLTPGFTISWFRMQMNERDIIFFLAAFLLCYLSYLKEQKIIYFILGLISANLTIYYKETAFIAIGAFAFFHLLLSWKTANKKIKIFDGLLLLSSFIYLLLYYFMVLRHLSPNAVFYNHTPFNTLLVFIKNFLNYGFFTDPILILILLPFTGWRIYKALRRQLELHPIYDSMLITGSMFVMGYFALNMYSPKFLLPAYIFALPPLIYFFSQRGQRTLFWKGATAVCCVALLLNVFPSGIHYLTYYKYLSVNFNKTLDFLIHDINTRYPDKRANIFLDAIDGNTGRDVYLILGEFLQYKGLSSQRFDLKSDIKTKDNFNLITVNIPTPFSVFQNPEPFKILKGDYLIISPDAVTKNITKDYIQSLSKDYDLILKTKSYLAFPNLDLKTLAKYFLARRLSQSQKKEGLMINENLIQSPDYYVFIRK